MATASGSPDPFAPPGGRIDDPFGPPPESQAGGPSDRGRPATFRSSGRWIRILAVGAATAVGIGGTAWLALWLVRERPEPAALAQAGSRPTTAPAAVPPAVPPPAPLAAVPGDALFGGRPASWWQERLQVLRRRGDDDSRQLFAATRRRAEANGLAVVEEGDGLRVGLAGQGR